MAIAVGRPAPDFPPCWTIDTQRNLRDAPPENQ